MMKLFFASFTFLSLGACAYIPGPGVSQVEIREVLKNIKQQVSVYYAIRETPEEQSYGQSVASSCKRGDIDFDITSVKAELAVTVETIEGGTVGLTLAVPSGVSVGPSFALSNDASNAQTLDFTEFPLPSQDILAKIQKDQTALEAAPIAKTLLALRHAVIDARAAQAICFTDVDPLKASQQPERQQTNSGDPSKDNSANAFKIAITVVKDQKFGLTVAVLQVISLGFSNEDKYTKANTLTITFAQKKGPVASSVAKLPGPVLHMFVNDRVSKKSYPLK